MSECSNSRRWQQATPHALKLPSQAELDFLDHVDEDTLKRLISELGLDVKHDLPDLKGQIQLPVCCDVEEEPER